MYKIKSRKVLHWLLQYATRSCIIFCSKRFILILIFFSFLLKSACSFLRIFLSFYLKTNRNRSIINADRNYHVAVNSKRRKFFHWPTSTISNALKLLKKIEIILFSHFKSVILYFMGTLLTKKFVLMSIDVHTKISVLISLEIICF